MTSSFSYGANAIYFAGVSFGPPLCECGRGVLNGQLPDGKRVCARCVEEYNRNAAIARAANWITAAFYACPVDQRQKLYRSLAAIFHPDTGGDERVMQVLNAVKERFP